MSKNKAGTTPLYQQIKNYLDTIIKQHFNDPEFRLPSENQIATQFGSSRVPVIQALRELEDEGKIYRLQGQGSFIKTDYVELNQPEIHICLLIPQVHNYYCSEIIKGARAFLDQHHAKLFISTTDDDPKLESEMIETVRSMQFQGLLFFPVIHNTYNDAILNLAISKFPTVFVARNMSRLNVSSVFCDPYNCVFHAVEYLHARGFSDVGFISEPTSYSVFYEKRLQGYQNAMQQYYRDSQNAVVEIDFFSKSNSNLEEKIANDLYFFMESHPDITAFISTDQALVPFYQYLLSKKAPEKKYTILTFDSTNNLNFFPYQNLIVIDQNPFKIGYLGAEQLYMQIMQHAPIQNIDVPERFIVKSSASSKFTLSDIK